MRAREQCGRIGAEIKAARAVHGLSLQAAADRAGLSWSTALRVESGDPSGSIMTVTALAEAVGLDLVLRAYPGRPPSLRDTGQLGLVRKIVARVHPSIKPTIELAVGSNGASVDFQEQYRRAVRKRDVVAAMHQRPVRLVMAIEDLRRNRSAVEPHLELIRKALPAGSREILTSLGRGSPVGRDGLLWIRRWP